MFSLTYARAIRWVFLVPPQMSMGANLCECHTCFTALLVAWLDYQELRCPSSILAQHKRNSLFQKLRYEKNLRHRHPCMRLGTVLSRPPSVLQGWTQRCSEWSWQARVPGGLPHGCKRVCPPSNKGWSLFENTLASGQKGTRFMTRPNNTLLTARQASELTFERVNSSIPVMQIAGIY